MFGLEFIKEILPAPLPFGLDDKIFYSCREECEEGGECSKKPYSMNERKCVLSL